MRWLVPLVALGVAAVPAVIVYGTGDAVRSAFPDVLGPGSGPLFFLVLIYVVWLPATVVGMIWVLDHLGVHYSLSRRERRPSRRTSRRRRAGLRYLEAQDRARRDASAEAARRARDKGRAVGGDPESRGGGHRCVVDAGRPGGD